MNSFNFTPSIGLMDSSAFPEPTTEQATREQLQRPLNQIKDYINDSLVNGFENSKNTNGYTKLPNGMIIQWVFINGSTTPEGFFDTQITFPLKFTQALFGCANVKSVGGSNEPIKHFIANTTYDESVAVIRVNNLIAPSYGSNPIEICCLFIGY